VVNHWLVHRGFTVGFGDALVDSAAQHHIADVLSTATTNVSKLMVGARPLYAC
jgi:hypothetical protein